MRMGFSTNSISDTSVRDSLPILRDMGYTSVAITLDHAVLNPYGESIAQEIAHWRASLGRAGMTCGIETGARHLLDPLQKHEPTLVTAASLGRLRRIDFLKCSIDIAKALGSPCVSLWSGIARDSADEESLWDRLITSLEPVLVHAALHDIQIGFEPEPGMFIDTLARYQQLLDRLNRPDILRLTVDIGHMECMGERPASDLLWAWADRIINVHIDDMLACRHEHLPLGSGDVEFPSILKALTSCGYAGSLHIELPRQSHRWIETARQSAAFLRAAIVDAR